MTALKKVLVLLLCAFATCASAQRVSQLPAANPLTGSEIIPLNQNGITKVTTPAAISSYINPYTYPPSGDTTGATDGAAMNTLLAAGAAVSLQCFATYYTNTTIVTTVNGVTFIGCGQKTIISGVGVTGPIISVNCALCNVGNFQIYGTGTNALKASGSGGTHIHDINVRTGGSWVDIFWFVLFFGNQVDNLSVTGVSGSNSDFRFDGAVNADTFNNLYTAASFTSGYNFKFQDDSAVGASTGNTFNSATAQGGTTGFYFGYNWSQNTLNSPYTEATVFPMVFGNVSSGYQAIGWTINAPYLLGPDPTLNASNGYASRIALLDFEYASGITVTSPNFLGSYIIDTYAQLAFSGGGCTAAQTIPTGIARVNPSGVVSSVMLEFPGSGCTSTPTVTVNAGGTGSGATVTATCCTGGLVTALTLTGGGSNYGPNVRPMPVIFSNTSNISIIDPSFNSGLNSGLYPWIVKRSTAGTTSGIQIYGDNATAILIPQTSWQATADLLVVPSFSNQEYLRYINGSGTQTLLSVVPPTFP